MFYFVQSRFAEYCFALITARITRSIMKSSLGVVRVEIGHNRGETKLVYFSKQYLYKTIL